MSYKLTDDTTEREGRRWSKKITFKGGEIFTNTYGTSVTVIKHLGNSNYLCSVNSIEMSLHRTSLQKGRFKTYFDRRHYGVGYVGKGGYIPANHKQAYRCWQRMFKRCYSGHPHYECYKGTVVTEGWHNFQNFAPWYYNNYVEGYDLDKDIKSPTLKGKEYSPDFCMFVPSEVNKIARSIWQDTTYLEGKKHRVYVSIKNSRQELGRFFNSHNAKIIKRRVMFSYLEQLLRQYNLPVTLNEENIYV